MGTWGKGNFDSDTTADHLSILAGRLLDETKAAMAGDPIELEADEYWGVAVPCDVEPLALLAEQRWAGVMVPDLATVLLLDCASASSRANSVLVTTSLPSDASSVSRRNNSPRPWASASIPSATGNKADALRRVQPSLCYALPLSTPALSARISYPLLEPQSASGRSNRPLHTDSGPGPLRLADAPLDGGGRSRPLSHGSLPIRTATRAETLRT